MKTYIDYYSAVHWNEGSLILFSEIHEIDPDFNEYEEMEEVLPTFNEEGKGESEVTRTFKARFMRH